MRPVSVEILPNGMRVYAYYDRGNVSGIGVKCGSVHDPSNKRGLAHATEHLVTCRSKKYHGDELRLLLRKYVGKRVNIRTDPVSTFYGHGSLLRKVHMLKAFDIMASFLKDKILEQEGLQAEWAAIHQEYYQHGIDDVNDSLISLFLQTLYKHNPIRNRVDCEPEELKNTTLKDVRLHLRKHYIPANMFAIVFGPRVEEAKKLVSRYFGELDGGAPPVFEYRHDDDFPQLTAPREVEVSWERIHQHHVMLGFPTEPFMLGFPAKPYITKEAETLDVVAGILEMRLDKRLRDDNRDFNKGTYHVKVGTERTFVHGALYVIFPTTSADFAKEGTDIILEETKRLRDEKIKEVELDAIASGLDHEYLGAFQDSSDLAEMVIEAVCNGDEELIHFHGRRERLKKVTRGKVIEMANKYLTPNYVRAAIIPA